MLVHLPMEEDNNKMRRNKFKIKRIALTTDRAKKISFSVFALPALTSHYCTCYYYT